VSDVFDQLLGQASAVRALRRHVQRPVHAYFLAGSAGAPFDEAARLFATALQCPENGCGHCESCVTGLRDSNADIITATRTGVSWSVDDLREIDRRARQRPLSVPHEIIIMHDVQLAIGSIAALLKTIEEPAPRAIFILTGEAHVPELTTIYSRCVEVALAPLSNEALVEMLVRDGASRDVADIAARAANGDIRRAKVLTNDPEVLTRLELWRSLPQHLDGSLHAAMRVVHELEESLKEALAPLKAIQEEEYQAMTAMAKAMGQRATLSKKEAEVIHRREQRKFVNEEVKFGLATLTSVYRARLHDVVQGDDALSQRQTAASLTALDALAVAHGRLATTLDMSLLLSDLVIELASL
jgi:DNA polymerase III subunit delta'